MKSKVLRFIKIFSITFFTSCVLIILGLFLFIKIFNPLDQLVYDEIKIDEFEDLDGDPDNDTPLEMSVKESKIINVLIVGLEHIRTDTIMLASFDRKTKEAGIISIPRDTFIDRPGYRDIGSKRINAIYQTEDIDGLIDAVENIFQIPVHKYVLVDYKAVEAGIDAIGGVDFDVPIRMDYTDPYDDPPLVIDFQPGMQHIEGSKALGVLRFRKNNDGTGYRGGDIDRIQTQQAFVKEVIKKAIGLRLPNLINEVYPYVKTNFSTTELMGLAVDVIGFSMDNLKTNTLKGQNKNIDGASMYIIDPESAVEYTYELYKVVE